MKIFEDEYCIILENVFNENYISKIIQRVQKLKSQGQLPFDDRYKRFYSINDVLLLRVHKTLTLDIQQYVTSKFKGDKIIPSYVYLSDYEGGATLSSHTDRPQCEYTASYCLYQSSPWSFFIRDREYILEENQLILFKGREHPHSRKQLAESEHCCQVLFHFVDHDFKDVLIPKDDYDEKPTRLSLADHSNPQLIIDALKKGYFNLKLKPQDHELVLKLNLKIKSYLESRSDHQLLGGGKIFKELTLSNLHDKNQPDPPPELTELFEVLNYISTKTFIIVRNYLKSIGIDGLEQFEDGMDPAITPVYYFGRVDKDEYIFPHEDYSFLTVMAGSNSRGFQIKQGDTWLDIAIEPDEIVVIPASLLAHLSQGIFPSTIHRALKIDTDERITYPFFFRPHDNKKIQFDHGPYKGKNLTYREFCRLDRLR